MGVLPLLARRCVTLLLVLKNEPVPDEELGVPEEAAELEEDAVANGVDAALAHAVRAWGAEEENARRLGTRTNGLLALVTGLVAVALVKVGSLERVEPPWLFTTVRLLLGLGILLAAAAVRYLLAVKRRKKARPLASSSLAWPPDVEPWEITEDEAKEIAYLRTARAVLELRQSNIEKQGRVDDGQVLLVLACAAAVLALLGYMSA